MSNRKRLTHNTRIAKRKRRRKQRKRLGLRRGRKHLTK